MATNTTDRTCVCGRTFGSRRGLLVHGRTCPVERTRSEAYCGAIERGDANPHAWAAAVVAATRFATPAAVMLTNMTPDGHLSYVRIDVDTAAGLAHSLLASNRLVSDAKAWTVWGFNAGGQPRLSRVIQYRTPDGEVFEGWQIIEGISPETFRSTNH